MLFKLRVFAFWIVVVHVLESNATTFAAVSNMENLLETQKYVLESIKSNVRNITDPQTKLQVEKFISQCQKEYTISMQDVPGYLANPINSYRLIKRLASDLLPIEDVLRNTNYTRNKNLFYPNKANLINAKFILIISIYIYKLNVSDIADGTIIGNFSKNNKEIFKETVSPMTSSDCFELADASFIGREYEISLAFAKKALYKYEVDCDVGCAFSKSDVFKFLSFLYHEMGDSKNSLEWWIKSEELMLENYETRLLEENRPSTSWYLTRTIPYISEEDPYTSQWIIAESVNIWRVQNLHLCSGEDSNPKGLHCEYRSGPHLFLRLARFKVEVLNLDPEVVMLHDVISDREIETLRKLSKVKGKQTSTCAEEYKGDIMFRRTYCTSDSLSKVLTVLTQRSLDISGLRKAAVHDTKIIEYGVGGYQRLHLDIDSNFEKQGAIIARASVVYYISNTNQGGATVFPFINLTVFPVKHSAILWSTMLPSGQRDERTYHMACPVLHGNKWLAVKWLSDPEANADGKSKYFKMVSSL